MPFMYAMLLTTASYQLMNLGFTVYLVILSYYIYAVLKLIWNHILLIDRLRSIKSDVDKKQWDLEKVYFAS